MSAGNGPAPLPESAPSGARDQASNLVGLPFSRRELFADDRGAGLRASWHPERGIVVLSLWKGDVCAGTFRLPVDEAPRLAAFLAGADRAALPDRADTVDETAPLHLLRRDDG